MDTKLKRPEILTKLDKKGRKLTASFGNDRKYQISVVISPCSYNVDTFKVHMPLRIEIEFDDAQIKLPTFPQDIATLTKEAVKGLLESVTGEK